MRKKSIYAVSFLLAVLFVFSACNPSKPPVIIPEEGAVERNGVIKIMLPTSDFEYSDLALKAVAASYMDKYPDVEVIVSAQPSSTYKDWIDNQFSGGDVEPDIIQALVISNTYMTTKMVDYTEYLLKPNPHNTNTDTWKDGLLPEAYQMFVDRSGIYQLNLNNTSSFFFYNKEIWREAGLVDADGKDKHPKTWDELVSFANQIENNWASMQQKRTPFAIGGDSVTYEAMSWLLNMYSDQYFRNVAEMAHARAGDYTYDPEIDGDWEYNPQDPNNDFFENYNINPLRFLKAIDERTIGTDNVKYKAMLRNLMDLIYNHAQKNFTSHNYLQAANLFWEGNAAMVFKTTDFFNTYKNFFELDSNAQAHKFEIDFFPAPPMTGAGDTAPAADYVRSVGGATGWYGIVKKAKKQNDLAADFLMYLASPEGMTKYFDSMKSQKAYISGPTNVIDVELPAEVYPAKDFDFPGLCHNNPMGSFFGNLASVNGPAGQNYNYLTVNLFLNGPSKIDTYAASFQDVLVNSIPAYVSSMKWRADALSNVAIDPKI